MKTNIEKKYKDFINRWHLKSPLPEADINGTLREILTDFLAAHTNAALYGNGYHTMMLMSDYMYELKTVRYIVDSYKAKETGDEGGFTVISAKQLREYHIDGVIISSYIYRKEIKEILSLDYQEIDCLDLYEEFEKKGISLKNEYYAFHHPYHRYRVINEWNRKLRGESGREEAYQNLFQEYLAIKDFQSARKILKQVYMEFPDPDYLQMQKETEELSELLSASLQEISGEQVLMLCIDGVRREDLSEQGMSGVYAVCEKKGTIYTNAYSFSTSTYESLIPVYSENDDLDTEYYKHNVVPQGECRFVSEAVRQNRYIYFDTDVSDYVADHNIDRSSVSRTVSEKIWDFAIRASTKGLGLFYMHVLSESHYSFPNPYTEGEMVCEGTAMLFDYLPKKKGSLRTDYETQHRDALRYLDDQLSFMLERLRCRTVIFADHGNLILPPGTQLLNIKKADFTASEEWLRIPLVIMAPESATGKDSRLISLMELNNIVISLLRQKEFFYTQKDFIKAARSAIYNPDFKEIYTKRGYEQGLMAFEAFIFPDGHKLVVFADSKKELYVGSGDQEVSEEETKNKYFEKIRKFITSGGRCKERYD